MAFVAEIASVIVTMVTDLLGGLGSGIGTLFTTLFLNTEGTALSAMGAWVVALLGISIGLGAVAWVSTLIRNRQ